MLKALNQNIRLNSSSHLLACRKKIVIFNEYGKLNKFVISNATWWRLLTFIALNDKNVRSYFRYISKCSWLAIVIPSKIFQFARFIPGLVSVIIAVT